MALFATVILSFTLVWKKKNKAQEVAEAGRRRELEEKGFGPRKGGAGAKGKEKGLRDYKDGGLEGGEKGERWVERN
jgi:hypothetical protein